MGEHNHWVKGHIHHLGVPKCPTGMTRQHRLGRGLLSSNLGPRKAFHYQMPNPTWEAKYSMNFICFLTFYILL